MFLTAVGDANMRPDLAFARGIEGVTISVHGHDDLGMAVANFMSAIEGGARQVRDAFWRRLFFPVALFFVVFMWRRPTCDVPLLFVVFTWRWPPCDESLYSHRQAR